MSMQLSADETLKSDGNGWKRMKIGSLRINTDRLWIIR